MKLGDCAVKGETPGLCEDRFGVIGEPGVMRL